MTRLLCSLLALCALCVVCAACAAKTDWPRRVDGLRSLHVGMSKQDVLYQLGDPDAARASGNVGWLCYQLPAKDGSAHDRKKRAVWYVIKHVDNLVTTFGPATHEDHCG